MHLAEGTNPSAGDERLSQFSNSVASSQQSHREQVPLHIPSPQLASTQPQLQPHIPTSSSGNPSSLGQSKAMIHDPGAMGVRYKVRLSIFP